MTLPLSITDWRALPGFAMPADREVFAIGDIHGQAEALDRLLDAILAMPRLPGIAREIVFLGDLIDRGPESMRSIALAMNAARHANADAVTLLPGNHELMLLDGLDEPDLMLQPWIDCGGKAVLAEIDPALVPEHRYQLEEGDWANRIHRALMSALPIGLLPLMRRAPSHRRIGDLLFVHAGLHPSHEREPQAREAEIAAFLAKPGLRATSWAHWAWIRRPFLDWTGGWNGHLVVHGHTPANQDALDLLQETDLVLPEIDLSASHARICLDVGACNGPRGCAAAFRSGPDGSAEVRFLLTGA